MVIKLGTAVLSSLTILFSYQAANALPAIPELARWESQMLSYGASNCARLTDSRLGFDQKLAETYYDAEWVFYQIGDYTHDPYWYTCARAAEAVYRDGYVIPNNGYIPGYWNFTHGLVKDYQKTRDQTSRTAVVMLAQNAAYAREDTPLSWTEHVDYSREVAYTIMAYLNAEDVGERRRARLQPLVEQAFGHFDQWFVLDSAPYVRPFMVALTSHALISYYKKIRDPRVLSALIQAADWLWDNTWLPGDQSFMYTDRNTDSGGMEPAPDLNLLIAPMYAWLYHQTGEQRFLERGDQIFAGGVRFAWLVGGKQFNQNYRASFTYVRWRKMRPLR